MSTRRLSDSLFCGELYRNPAWTSAVLSSPSPCHPVTLVTVPLFPRLCSLPRSKQEPDVVYQLPVTAFLI